MKTALCGLAMTVVCGAAHANGATEFCLEGEFDLGARLQGTRPQSGEFLPATWCVVTEEATDRVHFTGEGHSNPDLTDRFAVSYLPPDVVRIVDREEPPDLQFTGAPAAGEARRNRRIDPRRLVEELAAHPEWLSAVGDGWQAVRYPGETIPVRVRIEDGRLEALETSADLPLRGTVPVRWNWDWRNADAPRLEMRLDGTSAFRARGRWRALGAEQAEALWRPSGGQPPREIPGSAWPARTGMRLEELGAGAWMVRGVRTGFHHLVVDTGEGLVVGDAPAGWVELQQIPPVDLVPGLGVSGLSERLIDFLHEHFPDRPLRAVALTHIHDDHAGGARAFAAAGAEVYAPAAVSGFLEQALNRDAMPDDRLSTRAGRVDVRPVAAPVTLEGDSTVRLLNIGAGPHVAASLGVHAVDAGFFFQSDLHVPISDAGSPREDRVATECWFARWAVGHLPPATIVVGSHGTVSSPVSRLARYLESPECRMQPRPDVGSLLAPLCGLRLI